MFVRVGDTHDARGEFQPALGHKRIELALPSMKRKIKKLGLQTETLKDLQLALVVGGSILPSVALLPVISQNVYPCVLVK